MKILIIFENFFINIYKHIFLEAINKLFQIFLFPFMCAPILRFFGAEIGPNARIYTPIIFNNIIFRNLKVGANCHIGRDVAIDLAGQIFIGDNVTISMRSTLITHINFGYSSASQIGYSNFIGTIIIEDGVYIGANTTILHDVKIGHSSIIGAGSLVRESIPPYSVAVGIPAKVVRILKI
jgi:maltose O-acetyltransferase